MSAHTDSTAGDIAAVRSARLAVALEVAQSQAGPTYLEGLHARGAFLAVRGAVSILQLNPSFGRVRECKLCRMQQTRHFEGFPVQLTLSLIHI